MILKCKQKRLRKKIIKLYAEQPNSPEAFVLQRKLLMLATKGTNTLYRFRPNNDYTLQEISTGLMYCSHPKDFNDSYDSNFGQGVFNLAKALWKMLIKGKMSFPDVRKVQDVQVSNPQVLKNAIDSAIQTTPNVDDSDWFFDYLENYAKKFNSPTLQQDVQTFKNMLQSYHALINDTINDMCFLGCLAIDCFNLLMWSHYASNEKGICIAYDFSDEEYFKQHSSILPIIYYNKRPQIPWESCLAYYDNPQAILGEVTEGLLTKSKAWEYEQEWRVIVPKDAGQYFKMPPIKCIYLGNKIEADYKQKVLDIARERNIPVYQMHLNSTSYTLVSKLIEN